jgi:hypothetical protein
MLPFYRLNANVPFRHEPYRVNTLTVFGEFNIKKIILMEFIRKARTVPRCVFKWKSIKNRYCGSLCANTVKIMRMEPAYELYGKMRNLRKLTENLQK